jgi:hypothetical protein
MTPPRGREMIDLVRTAFRVSIRRAFRPACREIQMCHPCLGLLSRFQTPNRHRLRHTQLREFQN